MIINFCPNLGLIDAARLQEISASNRFASDDLAPNEKDEMRSRGMLVGDNCHLFILPSYINHSCLGSFFKIDFSFFKTVK